MLGYTYTSRKQGFGSGLASPLVPVQSRTGTHGGIRPGSCAQGAGRASWGIGPGSSGPFGPGSRHEPGPMGLHVASSGWAWGETHWSRFVLRTGTNECFFLVFRVSLSPVPPLPLAGASVVSPFFASPTCSPSFPYAYYTLYYIHSTC